MKKIDIQYLKVLLPYLVLIINCLLIITVVVFYEPIFTFWGIMIFLCLHSIMLFVKTGVGKTYYKLKRCERMSHKRLELIRELIDIIYTYEADDELLNEKIRKAVNAKKVIDSKIVNPEAALHKRNKKNNILQITENEKNLYCLLKSGFSVRELSVMYEINTRAIYVRKHKVLKKIENQNRIK